MTKCDKCNQEIKPYTDIETLNGSLKAYFNKARISHNTFNNNPLISCIDEDKNFRGEVYDKAPPFVVTQRVRDYTFTSFSRETLLSDPNAMFLLTSEHDCALKVSGRRISKKVWEQAIAWLSEPKDDDCFWGVNRSSDKKLRGVQATLDFNAKVHPVDQLRSVVKEVNVDNKHTYVFFVSPKTYTLIQKCSTQYKEDGSVAAAWCRYNDVASTKCKVPFHAMSFDDVNDLYSCSIIADRTCPDDTSLLLDLEACELASLSDINMWVESPFDDGLICRQAGEDSFEIRNVSYFTFVCKNPGACALIKVVSSTHAPESP